MQEQTPTKAQYVLRLVCIRGARAGNHGNSRTTAANNGRFVAWVITLNDVCMYQIIFVVSFRSVLHHTIGAAHLKIRAQNWPNRCPGSGKSSRIRACNRRLFSPGLRVGRAWAIVGQMGSGARSSRIILKFALSQ